MSHGWDDELEGELLIASQNVLVEMLMAGEVTFPRSVIPEDVDLDDTGLVCLRYSGNPASAACVYTRSPKLEPNERGRTYTVHLLAAKARVTLSSSKDGKLCDSTPCAELRGLLYIMRLVTAILPRLPYKPAYIFIATDSESTISSVEVEDKILQAWFTNHTAEINDHMDDWQ